MISGVKDDNQKAPIYRGVIAAFPRAMEAVARAGAYGANKYSWDNWRNVSDGIERYSDAMARHLLDEAKGNRIDTDSRLPVAWSTAWNCLARLELMLIEEENSKTKV